MNDELLRELRENLSKISSEELAREIRELDASFASSGCLFDSNIGCSSPKMNFVGTLLPEFTYKEESNSDERTMAA